MKLKRFVGRSTAEVLNQVRDSLGADAVILSNRKIDQGIEILASLDMPSSSDNFKKTDTSLYSNSSEWAQDTLTKNVQMELKELKVLLQDQLAGLSWKTHESEDPKQAYLFRKLTDLGFYAPLAKLIARDVFSTIIEDLSLDQLWDKTYIFLSKIILTKNLQHSKLGGIATFIGPSGSGKTSVVAKLASQYSMIHGSENLSLFDFEFSKFGSKETLDIFSKILSSKVVHLKNSSDLSSLLKIKKTNSFSLIDTYGNSFSDDGFKMEIDLIKKISTYSPVYLVLPATYQRKVIENIILKYLENFEISGIIMTKLDEAQSLGPILSCIIEYRIPVIYVSDGQNIPADIHHLNGNLLALYASKLAKHDDVSSDEEIIAQSYFGRMLDVDA